MKSVIRTNKVIPYLDYAMIDKKYDILCLETSQKYIKNGARIIDAPLLNKGVKSVLFENGRRFYVLLEHKADNLSVMKNVLSDTEYGSSISIIQINSNTMKEHQLLQLLINGLAAKAHPLLRFNNLTGHLYTFMPKWILKNKNNVICRIPTLEVSVLDGCIMKLSVRTFTSTKLRNKITSKKTKFEDYPKYVLSSDNSLRRKIKGDFADDFILRQIDNQRNEIPFLDISSATAFENTKIGVLTNIVESFNKRYSGMAKITFQTISEYYTIDTRATAKENAAAIKNYLADKNIRIVDCIKNEQSERLCSDIVELIKEKYDITAKIGTKLSKAALNIRLIHNKQYYEKLENDPYNEHLAKYTIQHITFEDFYHSRKFAISTVINELIIKNDIKNGKLSLFDWSQFGFDSCLSFGISTGGDIPKYFFMTISPDGTFLLSEQQLDLFSYNDYSSCVEIFNDDKQVQGIIKFSEHDILAIRNTDMFTIPEMHELHNELTSGNTALRNKESREEYLTSMTEIRHYCIDDVDYYFVGVCGTGMKPKLQTAALIRSVSQVKNGNVEFNKLLSLMNVTFIRNGQLTVIPFPFKYLREYISLSTNINKD